LPACKEWTAALPHDSGVDPAANIRIAQIARECDCAELLEVFSSAHIPERQPVEGELDPLTFERFPELAATGIGALIDRLWLEAAAETDGSKQLRGMRAAYLLAASFLPSAEAAEFAFVYGKTLLQQQIPKRAIEPFKFVLKFSQKELSAELVVNVFFSLASCQEQLSYSRDLLSCADDYLKFAHARDLPDHAMYAILFKSKAQCALADRKGALSSLEYGLKQAQALAHENRNLNISAPDSVAAIGDTIRTEGLHENGVDILTAFAATLEAPNEHSLLAITLSEVGYTLLNIGDERGIAFLERAAAMNVEPTLTSRWRHSIESWHHLHGSATKTISIAEKGDDAGVIDFYRELTRTQTLLAQERYSETKELAIQLVPKAKDQAVRFNAMTTLALSHIGLNETDAALRIAREAMDLANATKDPRYQMLANRTLALIFNAMGKGLLAISALICGIQLGEKILEKVSSLPFRRNAILELNSLVEMAADIYCASEMYERLLHFLEFCRAPNLCKWMNLESAFESANLQQSTRSAIVEKARGIREADIELDSDLFDGNFSPERHANLIKERDARQAEFDCACEKAGLSVPANSSRIDSHFAPLAAQRLQDGIAIVSFFQGSERSLVVGASQNAGKIQYFGKSFEASVDSLRAALKNVEGYTSSRDGGVAARRRKREATTERTSSGITALEQICDAALESLRSNSPDSGVQHLIVVPHDAFALLPWWRLADALNCSLTVAPSIGVASICEARRRPLHGPTLLIGDASGTLAYANAEVETIAALRHSEAPRVATSVREIIERSPEVNLLSFSCHGRYDNRDPYRSYLEVEESGDGFDHNTGLTAKVVMTRLSLDNCRLAILSACESGIPDLHESGEMTGLPNAFLVAGAKTVIASLWPVDDAATYILIRHFMKEWAGADGHTESAAVALKQARKALSTTTSEQARELLGAEADLPQGRYPFSDSTFVDAFHCFGAS
jgi:CHAT domain-containing protein